MKEQGTPDCLGCVYYHVTWNPALPRGCRLFGIKSFKLPALAVREHTGLPCPGFRPSGKNRKQDLKKHKTDIMV